MAGAFVRKKPKMGQVIRNYPLMRRKGGEFFYLLRKLGLRGH